MHISIVITKLIQIALRYPSIRIDFDLIYSYFKYALWTLSFDVYLIGILYGDNKIQKIQMNKFILIKTLICGMHILSLINLIDKELAFIITNSLNFRANIFAVTNLNTQNHRILCWCRVSAIDMDETLLNDRPIAWHYSPSSWNHLANSHGEQQIH